MPLIGDRPELNLNSVVYATDFSVSSQNAGFYAALLAKYFSARLLVAHTFTLSQPAMEAEVDRPLVSEQRKELASMLARKAAELRPYSVETTPILLEGEPQKTLSDLADQYGPSLLVLGTHGGNPVERKLIGSVAETILRSTRWPCLTVGPQVHSAVSVASLPFRRILYATDLTPPAARAAIYAISFAETLGAEIDVLQVIPEQAVDHPGQLHELESHFYRALDSLISQDAKDFCTPHTFVEAGKAHEQILDHIRERAIDLLVLGMQKESSGVFRLIAGATCPTLTIFS